MAHWILTAEPRGRSVGYVVLADVRDRATNVNLVRLVVSEKRRGYGRAVLELVQTYAFERLAAHRLWLDVFDFNTGARRLYASVGFQSEGVLRECVERDGEYLSLVVMSVLEHEYRRRPQRASRQIARLSP